MRHRNLILSAVAGLGILAGSAVQAAVLTMNIQLLYSQTSVAVGPNNPGGTINTPLTPDSPGVYTLNPGAGFRVLVTATLSSPNLTDGNHTPDGGDSFGPAGQTLGIQSLSARLVSGGLANVLTPNAGTASNKWGANVGFDATPLMNPTSIAPPFVGLNDEGVDGDLDPVGIGYVQTSQVWNGDITTLPPLQNGLGATVNVFRGGYSVTGAAGSSNTLTFTNVGGLAFVDPAAADNSLSTEAFANIINSLVTINVTNVPEPATAGLLGLASLGLLGARRRRA